MKVPFKVDLSGKVVAITGAGGVICSEFARALAECGAKVALLDINFDAAKKYADADERIKSSSRLIVGRVLTKWQL